LAEVPDHFRRCSVHVRGLLEGGCGMSCIECPRELDRHAARGLCKSCYERHRWAGTRHDLPRATRTREQVLEAWELYRDKWEAARALSMKTPAFERALQRARATQTPRPALAGRGQ
jgi:hypothetical protein